jgi:hypothetical protein
MDDGFWGFFRRLARRLGQQSFSFRQTYRDLRRHAASPSC